MKRCALVADLGGTKIAAARVEESGKLTHPTHASTPPVGGMEVVKALVEALRQLGVQDASAVCVAVPGLAYSDGSVWAPNIPGWARMPLGPILRKRFHLPVLVESDRNAFVTGEVWKGAARGCADVIFIAIGTGIGAGIISGGRLIRGSHELSGCLGWMAVRDRYEPVYRSVGCLEAHLAGPGIAHAGRLAFHRSVTSSEIVNLARKGNRIGMKILSEAGQYLGAALANLVDILNPEMIVLGGGVSAAGPLLIKPAVETMRRWAQPLAVKQVRVVRSRLGVRAGLLGAAKLGFERFHVMRWARQ